MKKWYRNYTYVGGDDYSHKERAMGFLGDQYIPNTDLWGLIRDLEVYTGQFVYLDYVTEYQKPFLGSAEAFLSLVEPGNSFRDYLNDAHPILLFQKGGLLSTGHTLIQYEWQLKEFFT